MPKERISFMRISQMNSLFGQENILRKKGMVELFILDAECGEVH